MAGPDVGDGAAVILPLPDPVDELDLQRTRLPRATRRGALLWNNPKLHTPERRKVLARVRRRTASTCTQFLDVCAELPAQDGRVPGRRTARRERTGPVTAATRAAAPPGLGLVVGVVRRGRLHVPRTVAVAPARVARDAADRDRRGELRRRTRRPRRRRGGPDRSRSPTTTRGARSWSAGRYLADATVLLRNRPVDGAPGVPRARALVVRTRPATRPVDAGRVLVVDRGLGAHRGGRRARTSTCPRPPQGDVTRDRPAASGRERRRARGGASDGRCRPSHRPRC